MTRAQWVAAVALCLTGAASSGRAEDALRVGSVWEGPGNHTTVDSKGKTQQGGGEGRLEVNSRNGKNFSATWYRSNKSLILRGTLAEGGEVACTAPNEVDNLKQFKKDVLENFRMTGRLQDKTLKLAWEIKGKPTRGTAELYLKGPPGAAAVAQVKARTNDARMLQVINDLEALFRSWDQNKDGYADATELARAFRGDDAKPYQPAKSPETSELTTDDKSAAKKAPAGSGKNRPAPVRQKYPDYDFVLRWDQDRDDRISLDEYAELIRLVVAHYQTVFRKQDDLERFQTQLAKEGLTSGQRAELQVQMKLVDAQLSKEHNAFQRQLDFDSLAASAALHRANWAWYKTVNSATAPRRR